MRSPAPATLARTAILTAAVAISGAAPASAAQLVLDRNCYAEGQKVTANGTGFAASSPYRAELDGLPFGSDTTDASGRMSGSFKAPDLASGVKERLATFTVTDEPGTSASDTFRLTEFSATFSPQKGSPARLRVRFKLYGFGAKRTVFLHYVSPSGRLVRTSRLGRTTGTCGRLSTPQRRLFPFTPAAGRWRLQYDTKRSYERTARPRIVQPVTVR